jgi:hypothetical protein
MGSEPVHVSMVKILFGGALAKASPYVVILSVALGVFAPSSACAQPDVTGSWGATGNEDLAGDSVPVDYTGVPLNQEGRLRALTYNESQYSMIERQCQGLPVFYFVQGPFGIRIWNTTEPVKGNTISYTVGAWENRAPLVIWMDGRPHPSKYAEHTRGGFTTGHWEGNTLVAYTTHMKANFIRKTGPPLSDEATLTTRFYRHGDVLTVLAIVEDPIYLTEPQIMTRSFQLQNTELSPVGPPCVSAYQGRMPGDSVPHYVPEQNPFVDEMTDRYGVPRDAALGMPETLYPEYRKKMKPGTRPAAACTINCVSGAAPAQR